MKDLECAPERAITKEDFELLKRISGGPRLWYITGAHMAQTIDEKLGRDTLIQTIINGADNFFEIYSRARQKRLSNRARRWLYLFYLTLN